MITLDVTKPALNIFAPKYTTKDLNIEFIIQSDELLADWQDFYFIDELGNRHDVIFQYLNDHFYGLINFSSYPDGKVTLYAQIMDLVNNLSDLTPFTIYLNGAGDLKVKSSVSEMNLNTHMNTFKIITSTKESILNASAYQNV